MSRVIVATMWHGPQMVGVVDEAAPPTAGELDVIALELTPDNCGVKPAVRVLDDATPPAYVDSGEPVCEDRWPSPMAWALTLRR